MHAETQLALHHSRAAELQAEACAHRLAAEAKQPRDLRVRLGLALVEVGRRIAATPQPVTC